MAQLKSCSVNGYDVITTYSSEVRKVIKIKLFHFDELVYTGDGKEYMTVTSEYDNYYIIGIEGHVYTVSTSGLPSLQINNTTTGQDILSTLLTIDANENDSSTATTPVVINKSYNLLSSRDVLRFDVDVSGTGTRGFEIDLILSKYQIV